MQEKERQIRELFELTMSIARKTEHEISFEFLTNSDLTTLHIYDMKAGEAQKAFVVYPYVDIQRDEYYEAKKYFEAILEAEAS